MSGDALHFRSQTQAETTLLISLSTLTSRDRIHHACRPTDVHNAEEQMYGIIRMKTDRWASVRLYRSRVIWRTFKLTEEHSKSLERIYSFLKDFTESKSKYAARSLWKKREKRENMNSRSLWCFNCASLTRQISTTQIITFLKMTFISQDWK